MGPELMTMLVRCCDDSRCIAVKLPLLMHLMNTKPLFGNLRVGSSPGVPIQSTNSAVFVKLSDSRCTTAKKTRNDVLIRTEKKPGTEEGEPLKTTMKLSGE